MTLTESSENTALHLETRRPTPLSRNDVRTKLTSFKIVLILRLAVTVNLIMAMKWSLISNFIYLIRGKYV